MAGESAFSLYVAAGIACVVVVGFLFPPLTTRGPAVEADAAYQTHVIGELAYCRSNRSDVNCACFARKAGHIMSFEGPQVRGFVYADRSELARGQAGNSC
ncbi:hypothetical protein [uncultured Roseobacter sp.]|uniref:hypothetical protein n=1 Tax=uncultured Roseobacter sp. TaxID=114847 RepID=UPI0026029A0D|nr:hypothetical protein [uncultured Roseobacter sp.]